MTKALACRPIRNVSVAARLNWVQLAGAWVSYLVVGFAAWSLGIGAPLGPTGLGIGPEDGRDLESSRPCSVIHNIQDSEGCT